VRETFAATADAIGARGRRAIYVGYSMGGRLCLRLALDYPDLVRALVLVSTSPGIPDEAARRARIASDEDLARMVERDGVDAFLDKWLAQPMFATVPPAAAGLADRRSLSPTFVAHCLRVLGAGAMEPMWSRLGELAMPVALVTGTFDTRYDAVALQMLERLTGTATHVRLDGGHALPLEQPAVLGGFITAFAAEHG
jgi:2-succinyl-6-hydroxy-2,4-cyclohexadiene-1-carboxylate synthase